MSTKAIPSHVNNVVSQRKGPAPLVMIAWGVTLLVSVLPDIILQEIFKVPTTYLFWAKLGLLALLIGVSFMWPTLRPLRPYFLIFVVLNIAGWISNLIADTAFWKSTFSSPQFTVSMLGNQLLRLFVALVMLAALYILKRDRRRFFLTSGDLHASAEPVSWLGITNPVSWFRLGPIAALCITLGTLAFMLLAGVPSLPAFTQILPLIPIILILAAMNAFGEQVSYRVSLLATLHDVVGRPQALLLAALYFGLGHFYGVPYGVVGVAMAGFLGWFLAKAMLETNGFFWPWFIHFCQDVAVFTFIAMGSITPGGK